MCGVVPARAQFDPIGFEGSTIYQIPYSTGVGIPNGTPVGSSFGYTFIPGNNLQGISGVSYYSQAPSFGWRIDGYQATDNTSAQWNVFNNSYIGNGAGQGEGYPGTGYASNQTISDAININRDYSPANGNLPSAPGLGSQFLDVWASRGNTSQIALDFRTTTADTFFMTLAFGGRDAGSATAKSYYRLLNTDTSAVVFSGDTSQTPFEAWKPINTSNPSAGSQVAAKLNDAGVIQQDWEYFKQTFGVTANTSYTLQVLLPEEVNLDLALGAQYNYTPGVITDFSAVPEASTYGLMGLGATAALMVLHRRSKREKKPV